MVIGSGYILVIGPPKRGILNAATDAVVVPISCKLSQFLKFILHSGLPEKFGLLPAPDGKRGSLGLEGIAVACAEVVGACG